MIFSYAYKSMLWMPAVGVDCFADISQAQVVISFNKICQYRRLFSKFEFCFA